MDQVRQIRFLIPPLVLMASVFWGAASDPRALNETIPWLFNGESGPGWITMIAGGGVAVLSMGFILGTATYALVRFPYFLFSACRTHEVSATDETLKSIAAKIGLNREPKASEALYIVATFDHGHVPAGIHDWTVRRWNAFNINASSAIAVLASLLFGRAFGIAMTVASRNKCLPSS